MFIANSALRALLAIYHLISNARSLLIRLRAPRFLRADSQRGAAELTIARRKRGRVLV